MAARSAVRSLSGIKLVTFDVTGTLLNLSHPPGIIYERVAREEFGLDGLDALALNEGFRKNFKRLSRECPNYGREQQLHWKEWWARLVQGAFKDAAKIDISRDLCDRLISLFGTNKCWMPTEGSLAFVRAMQERGMRTGVITNSDPRTADILRNLEFPSFDFVHSAYDTGFVKPDKRSFEAALQLFDPPIKATEAMHVGNDEILDYEAARNCNWTGVLINKDLDEESPGDFKFKSLSHFLQHIHQH